MEGVRIMAYTNSPLVSYTKLSPNNSGLRNHAIDTITIHSVVGQCSVETLGNVFAPVSRQASSNYGVGVDGRIGMYVEEKNRSWCTSSSSNDNRAITIEVASDTTTPYAVNAKAYAALINLVTDICKRNGIKKLLWKGDKSLIGQVDKQNMTVHRWFANKSCPGDYLYSRHGEIAAEVNKRLGTASSKPSTPSISTSSIKAGNLVKISANAKYYDDKTIPSWVKNQNWYVKEVTGDRAIIDKSENGKNNIYSAINIKFLSSVSVKAPFKPYSVKVTADILNIRKGPGITFAVTGSIKNKGVYTIIEEKGGWGKLKSGAGWIFLSYCKKV